MSLKQHVALPPNPGYIVYFLKSKFDWGGERLLVRVTGRFQKWGFHPLICSLRPVRLLWWKGGRKENHATTVICKQTNLIVQHGSKECLPQVWHRFYTCLWIHHCCTLLQPSHRRASWCLLPNFLHLMHRVTIFFHSLEIKYYITKDYNSQIPADLTRKWKDSRKLVNDS